MYAVIMMGGRQLDALILSASPDRLRMVIPGRADTAEFRLVEGNWISESGTAVEIAAVFKSNSVEAGVSTGLPEELVRTAG